MPVPFWNSGATAGFGAGYQSTTWPILQQSGWGGQGSVDCLLPDLATANQLSDSWAWNVIYMASQRVPGIARVKFSREHRVDKRAVNGGDGETLTSLGYKASDIEVQVTIWTPQQLADFQNITIPAIHPTPGKSVRPKPVIVDHPALSIWGIKALFVTKVAGPEPTGTPGVWEIKITASEMNPIVQVGTNTPKGAGVAAALNALTAAPLPSAAINNPKTGQ